MRRLAPLVVLLLMVPSAGASAPEERAEDGPLAPPPAPSSTVREEGNYSDVLLLINNRSAISMQVGNYFKLKRGMPDQNVCNISMPTSEGISQSQFATVRTAIEAFITASGQNDTLNYIVVTKGCPLTVWGSGYTYASFMDELSLVLGRYSTSIGNDGWLDNPFFGSGERFSRKSFGFFAVTRLDGYDLADCLRLVDNARNSTGARGTFVLDSQPWKDGGGYQEGNDWCREANRTLVKKGWQTFLDDTPTYVVGQKNVSGYASWGSNDGNAGNNAKTGFTWVPGAVGTTYVSTSARSFSYPPSYGQSLIADNIREGITGIHGNVAEPFLYACARPNFLLDRYTRGWNLAESFLASMATASWQNCVIGDPKIAPYADLPDPAVLDPDISFSASLAVETQVVTLNATVRNLGGGPAENVTAAFYDGHPLYGGRRISQNFTLAALPPGGSENISAVWDTSREVGPHSIFVNLTPGNATPQLWDGNDRALRNITVFSRPELVLPQEKFTLSNPSPREGERAWVNFTVRNTGGFQATTTITCTVDGVQVLSKVAILPSDSEHPASVQWDSSGKPGARSVRVAASAVEYELNASNNELSAQFFVRTFGFRLETDAPRRACLPGKVASFELRAVPEGNSPEAVELALSTLPVFWTAELEPASAVLFPDANTSHSVLVYSPSFATVSDGCDFTVRCTGALSGLQREVALSVTTEPVRSIRLDLEPSDAEALPGEEADFKLSVRNLGNGPDRVGITFSAPENWTVELESPSVDVPYQGQSSVTARVFPDLRAHAGRKGTVSFTATSAGGPVAVAECRVEVGQVFGLEASLAEENLTLRPGEEAGVGITVSNSGNGPASLLIVLPDTDLILESQPAALSLEPFSSENVTLWVKVPATYMGSRDKLQLRVEPSSGTPVLLSLTVKVVRPDIGILKGSLAYSPASPVAGERVGLSLGLRNGGTGASGPVTVRLSERGSVLSTRTLDDLLPGAAANVSFEWNATEGDHVLMLTAECAFPDPTPGDTSVNVTFSVAPAKPPPRPSPKASGASPAQLAGGAAVFLAIFAAGLYLVLRARKGSS